MVLKLSRGEDRCPGITPPLALYIASVNEERSLCLLCSPCEQGVRVTEYERLGPALGLWAGAIAALVLLHFLLPIERVLTVLLTVLAVAAIAVLWNRQWS
jgi:hypothetical protein